MHRLIDNTPLELDELAEQCFALAYSMVRIEQAQVRESLLFILVEKLSALMVRVSND
jgi:hypothetical protein